MSHMEPYAEYMTCYHVETENGTEVVPEEVCGYLSAEKRQAAREVGLCSQLQPYLSGSNILDLEVREGFYARLSANGYLDCTEWIGPFDSEDEAFQALDDEYGPLECVHNDKGFDDNREPYCLDCGERLEKEENDHV